MTVPSYSVTADNNVADAPPATMLVNQLDNAIRATQADIRVAFNDLAWFEYGDGDGSYTATYISGTSFKIVGADVSEKYLRGRRVRAVGAATGTIVGSITSVSYADPDTTVVVSWDSGSLQSETLAVSLSIVAPTHLPGYGGQALFLDSDLDTYFIASTDDRIDGYVGGTRVLQFRTTGFLYGKSLLDSGATAGFETRTSGVTYVTMDGGAPLIVNRLSSTGDVIQIEDDNTKVGSIGTDGTNMTIDSAKLTNTESISGTAWEMTGLGSLAGTALEITGVDLINGLAPAGAQDLSSDGSSVQAGGLVIKWGSATSGGGGTGTVTFGAAFGGSALMAVASARTNSSNPRFCTTANLSNSGFDFSVFDDGGSLASGVGISWIAIGSAS